VTAEAAASDSRRSPSVDAAGWQGYEHPSRPFRQFDRIHQIDPLLSRKLWNGAAGATTRARSCSTA